MAFVDGMHVVAVTVSVLAVGLAVLAFAALRSEPTPNDAQRPNEDPASEPRVKRRTAAADACSCMAA